MSNATTAAEPVAEAHNLLREGAVLLLMGLSIVLVIMNTMMFNLALPDVSRVFDLPSSAVSWTVTGYSIVFAISSITYSRLSDFVPIRRLFIIGLMSLGIAAVAGLFSGSFIQLLAARLVQASGAGSIPALSIVLVTRYVPLERRGKAMAAIMSAASLGLGLGPVMGGIVVQYLGWHYLFVVTALTLLLIPLYLKLLPIETPRRGSFDVLGALFSGLGTTGLLLFLTTQSWYYLVGGLVALLLFAIRIRRASDPFVQPDLFRNRPYLTLSAIGIVAYMCSFATLYLLPQILVHQFELSVSAAGLVIFPGSLLAMLLSNRVGRIIDKYGNGVILRYAPLLVLASAILFALFASTSYLAVLLIYMLLSVGFTFLTSSVSNEMSRMLPQAQIGSGMGLFQLLQFFSGAFGVAVSASALGWQKSLPLADAYSHIYWGLTAIALVSIGCSLQYFRYTQSAAQRVKAAGETH